MILSVARWWRDGFLNYKLAKKHLAANGEYFLNSVQKAPNEPFRVILRLPSP